MGMDRKIERKKGLKPKHIIYIIAGLLFTLLLVKIINNSGTSVYKTEKEKLTIEEVVCGQFNDYTRMNGIVEPITTIYLDAIEGGRVEEKIIEEGADVKKGDIILRLSNPDLNLSILNSQANLAEQENHLRNTMVNMEQQSIQLNMQIINLEYDIIRKKRAYLQNKELFENDLIAKEVYLQSKEDYEIASKLFALNLKRQKQDSIYRSVQIKQMNSNLGNMRLNLEMVRNRVENLNVKAPIDGQLGFLDAEIGQSIGRGMRIGQVNVLSDYKIEAQIDEHYIDRVRHNLDATFERQNRTYALRIKKVYPEVREGQFKIDLVFTGERPENIRTGQTYFINLQLGQPKTAIIIPKGGFFQSTGGQWIYVLDESGSTAVKRDIKIGRQNPKYYEVIEGLQEGEKVITSSYDLYGNNDMLILK